MRICPIASGSSGNCIYIGTGNSHILVDAGISGKRTIQGLNSIDVAPEDIDAILVTHEHSDHISGLGVLARKFGIPIFSTDKTIEAIKRSGLGKIDEELYNTISVDNRFAIGDIYVNPMRISHDAASPVAYRFEYEDKRAAIATDMGTYDDYTIDCLQNMDVLLLEANHDINMLQVGPYPYPLKQRILSDRGHLSNESAGRLLSSILHDNMKHIYLGHLSKENNYPELAYESVRMEITVSDTPYNGGDFRIEVAKRSEPSTCIEF